MTIDSVHKLKHCRKESPKCIKQTEGRKCACKSLLQLTCFSPQVATDKVAGKLSSTLSWVKNSMSHTVSQMASQVATSSVQVATVPSSLQTTTAASSTSLSPSPTSASPAKLSPDELELLAKLEEQNR